MYIYVFYMHAIITYILYTHNYTNLYTDIYLYTYEARPGGVLVTLLPC